MIKNNSVSFNVTSKHSIADMTSSSLYCNALEQALLQMQTIFLSDPKLQSETSTSLEFTHPTSSAVFMYPSPSGDGNKK